MEFKSFPSIEQFRNVIRNVQHKAQYVRTEEDGTIIMDRTAPMPSLQFVGTVKLHGTNAAVGLNPDGTVYFQSRNRTITPDDDNAGFATAMSNTDLSKMFSEIDHFGSHILVFGEWCCGNIQKNVALSNLSKRFVVFSIVIDGVVMPVEQLSQIKFDMEDYEFPIHNIYDFPHWYRTIDFNNPSDSQNELVDLTMKVEAECPVGKQLGSIGTGEGIVWRSVTPGYEGSQYTFKVKGEQHSVSKVKTLAPVDTEKMNSIKEFVDAMVTTNRLNQGLEYLREHKLEIVDKNVGEFLRWVAGDITKEESDTIEASGLDKKEVNRYTCQAAKKFYFEQL